MTALDNMPAPDGAEAMHWRNDIREVRSNPHEVGGFKVQIQGIGWQDIDGVVFDSHIIFSPWKKHSYFEESDDVPPFTPRQARQMAHVLLALAEEVEGWAHH